MISRVLISKKLLAEFRKRASEAYPNEVMQTLWGRIEGDNVIISSLRTPDQESGNDQLLYHYDDAVAPQSAVRGEHYLGTIHSHPDASDATPSQEDWDTAYSSGERIFGVMRCERQASGRFKTEFKFWEPRAEITIVSPRVRNANRNQLETKSKTVQVLPEVSGKEAPALPVPALHVEVHDSPSR